MIRIAARRSTPCLARALLALGLVLAMPVAHAEQTMAEAMAVAIARMMEAMGFADSGAASPGLPGMTGGVPGMGLSGPYDAGGMTRGMANAMTGLPSPFGTIPGMSAPVGRDMMKRMADQFSGQPPLPAAEGSEAGGASVLEGVWEDNQNGLLIVQDGFYRIYSACKGYIEGALRIATDHLELTNQRENFTRRYEYALDQGRLVLRDESGQVFLYRRLTLGRAPDASSR